MLPLLFKKIQRMTAHMHAVNIPICSCFALFLQGQLVLIADAHNRIIVTEWQPPYDASDAGTARFTTGRKDGPRLDGSCEGEQRPQASKKRCVEKQQSDSRVDRNGAQSSTNVCEGT